MFYYSDIKKYRRILDAKKDQLEDIEKNANNLALDLYLERKSSIKDIENLIDYVNELDNFPEAIQKKLDIEFSKCAEFIYAVNKEADLNETSKQHGEYIAAGGAALGSLVAVMGADAAMAVATAFGTTSTGVAISSLTGVAASNAALAWLGGGAIAAGGGGMTAGGLFLALAGPIGLGIASVAVIGGSFIKVKQNKAILETIKTNINTLDKVIITLKPKLITLENLLEKTRMARLELECLEMRNYYPHNYLFFDENQKETLAKKILNIQSLATLINQRIY